MGSGVFRHRDGVFAARRALPAKLAVSPAVLVTLAEYGIQNEPQAMSMVSCATLEQEIADETANIDRLNASIDSCFATSTPEYDLEDLCMDLVEELGRAMNNLQDLNNQWMDFCAMPALGF